MDSIGSVGEDPNSQRNGGVTASKRVIWGICFVVAVCCVGLGLFGAYRVWLAPVPGVRLVYEIAAGETWDDDLVPALEHRLHFVADRVHVHRLDDGRSVEVLVGTQESSQVGVAKKLVASAGELRFLIVADKRHHAELCSAVSAQDETSNQVLPPVRDVLDSAGQVLGRWVTVGRNADFASGLDLLKVDVANLLVRDSGTGTLIKIPAELSKMTQDAAFIRWLKAEGVADVDVLVSVQPKLEVGGGDLEFVSMTYDATGSPSLSFKLGNRGGPRFHALTTLYSPGGGAKSQLGIVFDDVLISAPAIHSPISVEGRITGSFTEEEILGMVATLADGQLPIKLKPDPVSETNVDVP